MIYIIIGQSGSGKTTFVKERFLSGETRIVEDTIPYTLCGNTAALGRYGIGKRTEGTDTLSYNSQEKIKELLQTLIEKGYDVVMEGDRINNPAMFDYVRKLGADVKLYLVKCSILTSMERLQAAGSTITISFVKATKTKAKRNYIRYSRAFNGEIIETEGKPNGEKRNTQNYSSPRWSMEIVDCSMPMSMDTYSKCAYNCLYCFAFFQKSHTLKGYTGKNGDPVGVRSVNPQKVINLFEKAFRNDQSASDSEKQFYPYIQSRRIMQWGGLADEFDEWERRFGVTLELLQYFDRIDYPLSFSTKAAWWTEDERYMSLFRKHAHNWHVKISIITADAAKAKAMEKGVPSPQERLAAIKRLSDAGIHVTLRLRPYIIGVSEDWKELITLAHKAGADSVTTEFFCMESKADDRLKERYAKMSEIAGFDIHKFYMANSKQSGYKRLNRAIKQPIIYAMREYAHSLGLRFHVSDAFCRECNDACNCCGVPPEWGVSQEGNIGNAIIIAREKGEVHFRDIMKPIYELFKFQWVKADNYNTGSNKARALNYDMTMAEFLRNNWNAVKKGTSPAGGYGGILRPAGKDENGDVVYKYAKQRKEEGNGKMD